MKKTIMIPFEIDEQFVEDVMVTALSSGIRYWCYSAEVIDKGEAEENFCSSAVARGGKIVLELDESFDDEGTEKYILDFEKFCDGFQKYITWCIENKRTFYTDPCDIDAIEADVIIQLALFNEVVFG